MMRRLVGAALGVILLAAPGRSDEISRWVDRAGNVHYTNTGSGGAHVSSESVPTEPGTAVPERRGGDAADGSALAARGDDDTFSATASNRRYALERDLRATQRQIRDLDSRLAAIAQVRSRNQRGSEATGGVATAADVRSDEEKTIDAQKDDLVKHADEIRGDYASLKKEVTTRFGALPAWWIDVR